MNTKWQIFSMLAAVYLLLSVSCSTTTMKTVWKDKNYQDGKLQKIFVIGVSKNPTIRRVFEDEFAAQLKAHGTDAVTSYSLIPSEAMLDKETVESKIKTLGADAVIVTRLHDRKKHRVYSSDSLGDYQGWYGSYSRYYGAARYRNDFYEYETVSLETNLYETRNGKMIWSGLSDTDLDSGPSDAFNEGTVVEAINAFIKTIVSHLSDSQLI